MERRILPGGFRRDLVQWLEGGAAYLAVRIWPYRREVRGATLEPLHKAAPKAVRKDPALHELLALIDALRDGRVREKQLAEKELSVRLRRLLRG